MTVNETAPHVRTDSPEIGPVAIEAGEKPYYDERLANGVKVVIMGPPHSGKSVFIDALIRQVDPNLGVTMLSGCPDGEGLWLQRHYDDPKVKELRRKGAFTPEFVKHATESVQNFEGPLAFIDIGGRVSDENRQLAAGATHAVILAGDLSKVGEWSDFAAELGIPVVAKLHSHYSGNSDVIHTATNEEMIASTHYLERGTSGKVRPSVQAVADILGSLARNNVAYWQSVAERKLDEMSVELTKEGILRAFGRNDELTTDDIRRFHDVFGGKVEGKTVILTGFNKGREMVALTFAALEAGATSVEDNTMRTGAVPVTRIEQDTNVDTGDDDLDYIVKELTDGSVFVDVQLEGVIEPSIMEKMRMPRVDDRRVVLSGRIPHWLRASMAVSYAETNDSVAIFTPGEGNMIVWSRNKKEIGDVSDDK
ncbi:hypothetical protein EOL96_05000 [Candidatus Saccharibacteria bacterium]|nr:hypothetical protein [Candidatus Saccharibacteria bacterium]